MLNATTKRRITRLKNGREDFCMNSMQLYKSMQKRYLMLTRFVFRLKLMQQTATETSSQFKSVTKDLTEFGRLA